MSSVRPLERGDLPQVASLFVRVMRTDSAVPATQVAPHLEQTILDQPWADPEIPSLVYLDHRGQVQGFIASLVRRMRFDGRSVRMGCGAHLIAAPEVRNQAAGALLLRRYINGPQDLTITDTSSEETRRMWGALGGETAALGSLSWVRVFRPWLLAAARWHQRRPRPGALPIPLRGLCSALDAVTVGLAGSLLRTKPAEASAEALTVEALLAELPSITRPLRLYPDYDRAYLGWLFRELETAGRPGSLVKSLVRDGDRVLGWYLYYLQPGGISRLLQIASRDRDAGPVLDHLLDHARRGGSAALEGRVEPRLLEPLSQRRALLRYTGEWLLHSRDPAILDAAVSRRAMLTRMEGEWWSRPGSDRSRAGARSL